MYFKNWFQLNESRGIKLSQEDLSNIWYVQLPYIWDNVREIKNSNERITYEETDELIGQSDLYIGLQSSLDEPHQKKYYSYDYDNYFEAIVVIIMNDKMDKTAARYDKNQNAIIINAASILNKQDLFKSIIHELIHNKDVKIQNPVLDQKRRQNPLTNPSNFDLKTSSGFKNYMLSPIEYDAYTSEIANEVIFYAKNLKKTKKEGALRRALEGTLLFLSNPNSTEPTILDKNWTNEKQRTWNFYWDNADSKNKRKMQLRIYKAVKEALDIINSKDV